MTKKKSKLLKLNLFLNFKLSLNNKSKKVLNY